MDLIHEERKLSEYIIQQVTSKASGRADSDCIGNYPRDVYFIGSLRPVYGDDTHQLLHHFSREQIARLSPVAFGGEFKIRPKSQKSIINVKLAWSVYYRLFPSYSEQYKYQFQDDLQQGEFNIISNSAQRSPTLVPENYQRIRKEKLFLHFKKIECSSDGNIILNSDGNLFFDQSELEKSIQQEIERAKKIINSDPKAIRIKSDFGKSITINNSDLSSEEIYNKFILSQKNVVLPDWDWHVDFKVKDNSEVKDPFLLISFEFVNTSRIDPKSPNIEGFFFDPSVTLKFKDIEVLPFEVDLAKKGFRYNQNIWTKGFNCGIKRINFETFQTNPVPVYYQKRYKTKQFPSAPFEQLSQNPIPILESILSSMESYKQEWDNAEEKYKKQFPNWKEDYQLTFQREKENYFVEIDRFREGISLIKENKDILMAFQLTNLTFQKNGVTSKPQKTGWRLFQIVFLVSQIADIFSLTDGKNSFDNRKIVDIIYFPTGGGKTEAYLGVIIFHCFFDRLRGKSGGNTAWLRFPLRLLTLQQTQRMADIIGISEIVRKNHSDPRLSGVDVDKFSVGYYVGESSTPNEIKPPNNYDIPDPNWFKAQSQKDRQLWKRVVKCPSCGTKSIVVDFNETEIRIVHRCTNRDCAFPGGEIPIYIVDNEIYRYLPTVIVGTIDKLAQIGLQRKVSLILGKIDGKCEIHGYYNGTKCTQTGCSNNKLINRLPNGLSGPSLFIQDELHLIKEGLGTFDSHYETFIQKLLEEFGNNQPLKIIASSATIEAFERQVEHLYGRERNCARIFPGIGPTLQNSFYAETLDDTQRIYLGIIPHNKTILRAIIEFIQYYHETIENLKTITSGSANPYGGKIKPGSTEWQNLIDLYSTSLYYFLKKSTLDSIGTSIKSNINPGLEKNSYTPINFAELAGGTSSDEVSSILEKLETYSPTRTDNFNLILATSMISHGVDIDRLNSMIFYGMPRSNAEYIQASSRVGRSHTGLIFDFFAPYLERDQSYYAYFYKYHEFLGQLVEPVAINRWSKFSIERTLPGLFMGVLLQIIANKQKTETPSSYYYADAIRKKISNGELILDDFIPILENSYLRGLRPDDPIITFVKDELSHLVSNYLDSIVTFRPTSGEGPFVSNALIPRPMRSLRDVDEKIEITIDQNGSRWGLNRG